MRRGGGMKRGLRGDMAFDTGVLLEFFSGSRAGEVVYRAMRERRVFPLITELNLVELHYVLCRKVGFEDASQKVSALVESGCIQVVETGRVSQRAARLKCERSISLADCFTIALGEEMGIPALFARREKELLTELDRRPFEVPILFLDEILDAQP